MTFLLLLFQGLFFIVLQTTVFQALPAWMGAPDLLFILLIFCAVELDMVPGLLLTLFFGFCMDLTAGLFLGVYATIYLLLFLLIKAISRTFVLQHLQHRPVLTALSYLLVQSAVFLFNQILAEQQTLAWPWGQVLLGTLLVSIFSIPLSSLFLLTVALSKPQGRKTPGRHALGTSGTFS